jgi:DNA invertase Pin-like site-specific DNA recombinase
MTPKRKGGIPLDELLASHAAGRAIDTTRTTGTPAKPAKPPKNGPQEALGRAKITHDEATCGCPKCVAARARNHEPTMIGYARVSTNEQQTTQQKHELETAGCTQIYADTISGAKTSRPELDKCLAALQPGDTLVIWKLDRLGRSLKHLLEISDMLKSRGIFLRSLTEKIDTATAAGKMLYAVLGAVAQFERDILQERTLLGIEQARRVGVPFGPKPKLKPSTIAKARKMLDDGDTPSSVARAFGVDRSTLWRALKRAAA